MQRLNKNPTSPPPGLEAALWEAFRSALNHFSLTRSAQDGHTTAAAYRAYALFLGFPDQLIEQLCRRWETVS
jgi:hypothetical protein